MKVMPMFHLFLAGLAVALLAGCAANVPSGKWQSDAAIQQAFEAGTILPDHTYYYLGSLAAPDTVIAIDNRFSLRSNVWAQVDLSQKLLREWLSWYRTEQNSVCEFRGGVIVAPDGQQVGIWYSKNTVNTIRMPEPGVIVVFQPQTPSGRTCVMGDEDIFSGNDN